MVKLCSISEAFLGSCAVFKKDLVDAEVRIVDAEAVPLLVVSILDGLLQLPDLTKEVESFLL